MKASTLEELKVAQEHFLNQIDMLALVSKYSVPEPVNSSAFTHRCRCPNPQHSGGQERSPSFYFSVVKKNYFCFGCNFHGNACDLIALMSGTPWITTVQNFLNNSGLDIKSMPALPAQNNPDIIRRFLFKSNLDFAARGRLVLNKVSPGEVVETTKWLEHLYEKIDAKFIDLSYIRLSDVKSAFLQAEVELSRKCADLGIKI